MLALSSRIGKCSNHDAETKKGTSKPKLHAQSYPGHNEIPATFCNKPKQPNKHNRLEQAQKQQILQTSPGRGAQQKQQKPIKQETYSNKQKPQTRQIYSETQQSHKKLLQQRCKQKGNERTHTANLAKPIWDATRSKRKPATTSQTKKGIRQQQHQIENTTHANNSAKLCKQRRNETKKNGKLSKNLLRLKNRTAHAATMLNKQHQD